VNHSAKEYVSLGGFKHSNTAENFFSIFKRGVIGTYHHMSEAHLGRYCREFDLRYNTRGLTDSERALAIVNGMVGRRLTYRRVDAVAA
jgi:ISXO2-like transposase domain